MSSNNNIQTLSSKNTINDLRLKVNELVYELNDWNITGSSNASKGKGNIFGVLTNDSSVLPAAYNGIVESYIGCGTQMLIYNGLVDESIYWAFTQDRSDGIVVSEPIDSQTATITFMDDNVDSATIVFKASRYGFPDVQKSFSITKVKSGYAIIVDIESSNGTFFKVGQERTTTLTAKVFVNGIDITDTLDASLFMWKRVSYLYNPIGDNAWNVAHVTGYKQIEITIRDLTDEATFFCDILKRQT